MVDTNISIFKHVSWTDFSIFFIMTLLSLSLLKILFYLLCQDIIPWKTGKYILIDTLFSCYYRVHTTEAYRQLILNEAKPRGGVGVGYIILSSLSWASVVVRFNLQEATVAKGPITRVTGDCLHWSSGFAELQCDCETMADFSGLNCRQTMWFHLCQVCPFSLWVCCLSEPCIWTARLVAHGRRRIGWVDFHGLWLPMCVTLELQVNPLFASKCSYNIIHHFYFLGGGGGHVFFTWLLLFKFIY